MPTPPPSPPSPPHSRLRTCLVGCGAVTLVSLLLVVAGVWYGWSLWRSAPPQWTSARQALAAMSPEERRARATALEDRLAREFSFTTESLAAVEAGAAVPGANGPSATKTLTIDPLDASAWLEERLPEWAANQGLELPDGLAGLAFWIEEGRPVVAGQLRDQVFSAAIDFQLQPDGRATARPAQVRGGQVQLPAETLIAQGVKELEGRGHTDRVAALRGEPFDPVVPIDNGRQTRITGYNTDGGTLNLKVRAEPRP